MFIALLSRQTQTLYQTVHLGERHAHVQIVLESPGCPHVYQEISPSRVRNDETLIVVFQQLYLLWIPKLREQAAL